MFELKERYEFDWRRIQFDDAYHIEYCITDICDRNCVSCSHLAPLAVSPNFVGRAEFERVVGILREIVPDAHTVWLTGGEPTLHPEYLTLLGILRAAFVGSYVGIYTNGATLVRHDGDGEFWAFTRANGIVWAVTGYDRGRRYFEDLFGRHGCANNLAYLHDGRTFFRLTDYSRGREVSDAKYAECGWERCKVNVRNGRIFNCPSAEFADLFAERFGIKTEVGEGDFLPVDGSLTRERLDRFRGPVPFCAQCDIRSRHKEIFANRPSNRVVGEWSTFYDTSKGG